MKTLRYARFLLAGAIAALVSPPAIAQVGTLATVSGQVMDLSRDAGGNLLYCTQEGDVGRVTTAGTVTILATAATAPFPRPLRGVSETPQGDLAVIDDIGDIWYLPGGSTPAQLVYKDVYVISSPTDLLVDAAGNHATTSRTPTSGTYAIDWVNPNGLKAAYYKVGHVPVSLAFDPLTGGLLLSDASFGGGLRLTDITDESHASVPLSMSTVPAFNVAQNDGDLAVEFDGDVWMIAGSAVWHLDRFSGTTAIVEQGFQSLRGITIAASSGAVPSATGWSVYVSEGQGTTSLREIGGADPPAPMMPPSLGTVPGKGNEISWVGGMDVYEMAVDHAGDLVVGGSHWAGNVPVRRIAIPSLQQSTIADATVGLTSRVRGIAFRPDGSFYTLGTQGEIHHVQEGPLAVTPVFLDPLNQIANAKDLVLTRDGGFYVPDTIWYNQGRMIEVLPDGTAVQLFPSTELRGAACDPFLAQAYVTFWYSEGFAGKIQRLDPATNNTAVVAGFEGLNYSNSYGTWPDGDITVDVMGNVYTCPDDEFSVMRFNTYTGKLVRFAAGYIDRIAGLGITRSTPGSGSTTGWSLYVCGFNKLWEIPGVPPAAPTILDREAPPIGRAVGYLSSTVGTVRDMVADPAGGGFLLSTSSGTLARIALDAGAATVLADSAAGLSGDLIALTTTSNGKILIANADGTLFTVDPLASYSVQVLFSDPLNELENVRGLAVDGQDQPLVSDRRSGQTAGRVQRLAGGSLELLAHTALGVRPAIDPLTGDVFVTEEGDALESGGEVLRIDAFQTPATAGHYRGDAYYTFAVGADDGGLAFEANGDFYVAAGDEGRIVRVDRSTGAREVIAGGYSRPKAIAIAAGSPDLAGARGASLFVLDGWTIFEHGIDGLPAPLPPTVPPALAAPADLRTHGPLALGVSTELSIENAADAGMPYVILPTLSGKEPGFPLSVLGNPWDDRIVPFNFDLVFQFAGTPGIMPGFVGVLDAGGASPPGVSIFVPNTPGAQGLDSLADFCWLSFDPLGFGGVVTVGGTAQLYIGAP